MGNLMMRRLQVQIALSNARRAPSRWSRRSSSSGRGYATAPSSISEEALFAESRSSRVVAEPSPAALARSADLLGGRHHRARYALARHRDRVPDGRVLADSSVSGALSWPPREPPPSPEVEEAFATGSGVSVRTQQHRRARSFVYTAVAVKQKFGTVGTSVAREMDAVVAQAAGLRRGVWPLPLLAFSLALALGARQSWAADLRR